MNYLVGKKVKYVVGNSEFDSEEEANKFASRITDRANARKRDFLKSSWYGSELLKNHNLNEYGIWKVEGEDPNPDFGGHHHNPHLGYVEGTLEEAIDWGVHQDDWTTWGTGGNIKKVNVEKLSKATRNGNYEENR
jgi:hypothetical protein